MAATLCGKVFGRLSPSRKFVDRFFLPNKTPMSVRLLSRAFAHFEVDKCSTRGNDARKKNVPAPALQVTRLLQTTSYLEKYYVKPNYLKKWGRRDIKRRAMFKEHEMERSSLRLIKKSDILPPAVREKAASDMDELPLNSSITRVRNRCVLTDRGRGNVGRFRVSRMMFRYFADKGLVAGVTRSQW